MRSAVVSQSAHAPPAFAEVSWLEMAVLVVRVVYQELGADKIGYLSSGVVDIGYSSSNGMLRVGVTYSTGPSMAQNQLPSFNGIRPRWPRTRNQARDQTRVSKEPAGLDFEPAGLELKPVGLELEPAGLEFGPKLA